jgi:hypothetical protein
MAFPDNLFPWDSNYIERYIGVITSEIGATLIIYIILKMLHFILWGFVSHGTD